MKTIISAVQTWTKRKIKDSVADWSQNDSNANNYVKNRTHWEDEPKEVTLFNGDIEIYDGWNDADLPIDIVVGTKYTVNFNGDIYVLTSIVDPDDCPFIGNPYIWWGDGYEDNGIPFCIGNSSDSGYSWVGANVETGTYKLSISAIQRVVHKLDKKFLDLPDNIATTRQLDDLYGSIYDEINNTSNNIYDEINKSKDYILLKDRVNGLDYKLFMHNGNLVTSLAASLDDFTYTTNDDGTYTITGWRNTYMGNYSTEMIIPDDSNIIL